MKNNMPIIEGKEQVQLNLYKFMVLIHEINHIPELDECDYHKQFYIQYNIFDINVKYRVFVNNA